MAMTARPVSSGSTSQTETMYEPVGITAGASSYFAPVERELDPDLFDGTRMKGGVRLDLMSAYSGYLDQITSGREQWLRGWVAGSAVTFQWRGNDDLDVLLGMDSVVFRAANTAYQQMSDKDIAAHLNEMMRCDLWPQLTGYLGRFEVTTYVNPGAWDIRAIHPRAAYSLEQDAFDVAPTPQAPQVRTEWEVVAGVYAQRAQTIAERYSQALTDIKMASSPAARADAERRFQMAVDQAVSMFDAVHAGRRLAFSPMGGGYDSLEELVWKSGKQQGWLPALKSIKDYHQATQSSRQLQTYGVELPDADTLVRRAVMQYR